MDQIIDHSYASEFFTGPGLQYRITDPYANFRHEECIVCHEPLRSDEKENQPILLTHSGNCAECFHAVCLMESMKHKPNKCPYCQDIIKQVHDFSEEVSEFGRYTPDEPERDVWLDKAELAEAKVHLDYISYAYTRLRIVEDQAFEAVEHLKASTETYRNMKLLRKVNHMLRATLLENSQCLTALHGRQKFFENMEKQWGCYETAYKYTAMTFLTVFARMQQYERKTNTRIILVTSGDQA